MTLDPDAYADLERRFEAQVISDRARLIEWVVKVGWGVYLPCWKPTSQVDYVIVGMEPSFGWAKDVEHGEKKVADGMTNFGGPTNWDNDSPLGLFQLSIERFLCKRGEYHLTDVSKGAMPTVMAEVERFQRYREWYSLLLDEIKIVGKSDASIIAIGKNVETFLKKRLANDMPGRHLYRILHYSNQASAARKNEPDKDRGGYEAFAESEFGKNSCWSSELTTSKKELVFTYKKQFERIRDGLNNDH